MRELDSKPLTMLTITPLSLAEWRCSTFGTQQKAYSHDVTVACYKR